MSQIYLMSYLSFVLAVRRVLWGLTTCLADMTVQMKIPAETKAMDRYLLAEYLKGERTNKSNQSAD